MSKKNLKRFAVITLAATMTFGSAMTVFAVEGVAEGTGSYEGGEMKYPLLTVTLPAIPEGSLDYIADPNGLIEATDEAKYAGYTFEGNGIFFLSDSENKKYTGKSAAQTLTNENAQDIDVTVKLEQKTAGSDVIEYSESATFAADDTANKIYLAITDGAASNPNEKALSANGAAVVKTTVAGVKENYAPGYDPDTQKYQYTLKESGLTDWNDCSFMLTGAINMKEGVKWGDDVTFPGIKVTWSYKEHTDAVFSAGTAKGAIEYATAKVQSVTSIMMTNSTGTYDAMVDKGSVYSKATSTVDADAGITTITLNAKYMSFYSGNVEATITYKDASGATKTEVLTLDMN